MHLLISLSKNIALSDLMMTLKKDSSKWIKKNRDAFRGLYWQDGCGAFSIGESQVRAVTDYVSPRRAGPRRITPFSQTATPYPP